MKRREATLEEWGELYRLTTEVGQMEPWRDYWDADLIALREAASEDVVYCSIMGRNEETYGIAFYEGPEGLAEFMLSTQYEQFGIPAEYAIFRQNFLACYWGDRAELDATQRGTIKELGYRYRGRNQWLYFLACREGYTPYRPNQEEVRRLTRLMRMLLSALAHHRSHPLAVDFPNGELYEFTWDEATRGGTGQVSRVPQAELVREQIRLDDPALIRELRKAKKVPVALDVDLKYTMAALKDKDHDRPLNPKIALIADHRSGYVFLASVDEPGEPGGDLLVYALAQWILQIGKPEKILVRNELVADLISDLTRICRIPVEHQRLLPALLEIDRNLEEMTRRS